MSNKDPEVFPMETTICRDCVHRFSRVIQPLDLDMYGIDANDFDDLAEGEEILVEQHVCLISHQDLDGEVRECNKFVGRDEGSLFRNNPY